MKHPWRRIAAWAIDCATILVWVGVTAAVFVPLFLAGVIRPLGLPALNVIGAVVVIVPVVLGLAAFEHVRGATVGKKVLGLEVAEFDGRPSFARALVRNAIKVAAPWLIGHAAVFAVVTDPTPLTSGFLLAAYILPIVYVVTLFTGRGRTAYDVIAGTEVRASPSPGLPRRTTRR